MSASRVFVAAATLLVSGCAAAPVPVTSAPPRGYRQLVSDSGFARKLRRDASYGPLEASGLKKTDLGQPGDWRSCLQTVRAGKPVYYTVFFVGDVIESLRQSVAIDRCGQQQQYMELPQPTPETELKTKPRSG